MGPHFCSPACHARHATPLDLARDAAEVCNLPDHQRLYDDSTPELIAAHVQAHFIDEANALMGTAQ